MAGGVEMEVIKVVSICFRTQYRPKGPTRTFVSSLHCRATGSSIPTLQDADLLSRFKLKGRNIYRPAPPMFRDFAPRFVVPRTAGIMRSNAQTS